MKHLFLLCLYLPVAALNAQDSSYYHHAHLRHLHPLPLQCAAIKVGNTGDAFVVKTYGDGIFDRNDGHGGARYFTDSERKVVLQSVIGVDHVIEQASLFSSDFPFEYFKFDIARLETSSALNSNTAFEKNIKLNDPPQKILKAFGIPNRDTTEGNRRLLIFEDSYEEWKDVLAYSCEFYFIDGKLKRITIYNGE